MKTPVPGERVRLNNMSMLPTHLQKMRIAINHLGLWAVALFSLATTAFAEQSQQVSQYGITWKFDKPYTVGKFVTGDWWVIGPVTVVTVTPAPGKASQTDTGVAKSIYGFVGLEPDDRMRNGSMIVLHANPNQGYDSRMKKNYDPTLSVRFPCILGINQSLISTISNESITEKVPVFAVDTSPSIFTPAGSPRGSCLALKAAAVLTCLKQAPPSDAFRPPYAGTEKTIYESKNIHWDILPNLKPIPKHVPPWDKFERFYQRPWLDHIGSFLPQFLGPSENQSFYGREIGRSSAMASLMLMLDVPRPQKEKLMNEFLQYGIDLYGLARCGRQWNCETAHENGRKWPIIFAGLMLGDKEMQELPGLGKTIFQEDCNTYYGKGWDGSTALYQICLHTTALPTHEETDPATWNKGMLEHCERYRTVTMGAQLGTALAVQLMKAKALWNHDAFFDYYDRWMDPAKDLALKGYNAEKVNPKWGHSYDMFTDELWESFRNKVPDQPGGTRSLKWVWDWPHISHDPKLNEVPDLSWSKYEMWNGEETEGKLVGKIVGHFVPNPKPETTATRGKSK